MCKLISQFISLFIIISVTLSGCASKPIGEEERLTIGFCIDTMIVERWQKDKEIMLAEAKERGIEVITKNANENKERQIEQVKELIEANVDAIVIIPYDKDGLGEILSKARNQGIKIISYDRLMFNCPVDAYVSFDNVMTGELMTKALLEYVPKGNFIIINGSPKDNNSFMLNKGYLKQIQASENVDQIKIISEVWADNWREEAAYDAVIEQLELGQKIDGVIASNDRLAEEAIRALAEYGLMGEVGVVGQDADLIACRHIIDGTQTATVYKPISKLVKLTLDLVENIEPNAKEHIANYEVIDNGYEKVPFYSIPSIIVTKENMKETIVNDGFHLMSDIYQ